MAKRLQHRGGTTSQHSTFTGAVREVTVDTDKNTLVVHDGATAGGHPLATATNFTSTGIDDNATSTAITIDSGERVRIGNTSDIVSPSYTEFMVIGDYTASQDNGITFLADATNSSTIGFTDDTHSTVRGAITYHHSGDSLRFNTFTTERMRITNAGNVGIGTSSPSTNLHVNNSSGSGELTVEGALAYSGNLYLQAGRTAGSGSTCGTIQFRNTNNSNEVLASLNAQANRSLSIFTNGSERIRIDSPGNVMVGTTDSLPGVGNTTLGVSLRNNNGGSIAVSRGADRAGYFNRNTNDGDIIQFRKDGTAVGSIGVFASDNIYISGNSSHAGIQFGSEAIFGFKNGSLTNTLDLGNASAQWRDLYLAGGLYVGGTGTANKLDDYEEGTWTPTLNASDTGTLSDNAGYYIKIGSMVFINCVGTKSGGSLNEIEGLPFTVLDYGANYNNSAINGRKGNSKVITKADTNVLGMLVESTGVNDNSASFGFSLTYYTDA